MNLKSYISRALRALSNRTGRLADAVAPPAAREKSAKDLSHEAWLSANGDRSLRLDYMLKPTDVVLDVGGYEGQWASDIYARYLCTVHIFEPVPRFCGYIVERFSANPSIQVYQYGLAAQTGEIALSVNGDASSTLLRSENSIGVMVRSFTEWRSSLGITEIALMKINIEGGEYELLESMISSGEITLVRNLQVQFHDFVPDAQTRMNAILESLAETHRPTYQFPFIWENWTRLEQS